MRTSDISERTAAALRALGIDALDHPDESVVEGTAGFMDAGEPGDLVTEPGEWDSGRPTRDLERAAIRQAILEMQEAEERRRLETPGGRLGAIVAEVAESRDLGWPALHRQLADTTSEAWADGALEVARALLEFAKPEVDNPRRAEIGSICRAVDFALAK